ncbi:MAG: hypothetical protein WCI48_04080 [Bacteroidota bacterium]
MFSEYSAGSIYHIARADFLQRVRSYYFLIAIGVCVFIIYSFVPALDAGYKIVSLGNYRGFYNSAWIGSMVSMCVPFFALIGFYLVNNAVKRDLDTGVGQIIATTRVNKVQYLTGKLLSNFAVLLLMLLVIAVMTIVMFLVRGETGHLELGKLLLPLLIISAPAMFIISALALFFDSLSGPGRGFANITYFFVWIFLVSSGIGSQATDVFGVNTCMLEIQRSITASHPDWNGQSGTGILIMGSTGNCKVFTWEGMNWSVWIILQRLFWICAAFGLVLLASLCFNRFDTSEVKEKKQRKLWFMKKEHEVADENPMPLHIKYRELPAAVAKFSFFSLVKAELQLMLRGKPKFWLILTAGLFIATVFAPLDFSYKFGLPLLWFLQVLILSKLGCRELNNRCNEYIFSAAFPLRRQLPATLFASILVMFSLAVPVMLRELFCGNIYALYAITVGAVFIPAFAISSGIISGGSKLFEVVFTIMVYGILYSVPWFDFTGAVTGSRELGITNFIFVTAVILLIMAFLGRKRQILHSA